MSGGFWKSIGSKLVDAGQAYVQQIRFINELKQLPADEARRRFVQHAQGLSAAARAGFTLTLTTLANSERSADAKRFLESLRGALANPNTPPPKAQHRRPSRRPLRRRHIKHSPGRNRRAGQRNPNRLSKNPCSASRSGTTCRMENAIVR